MPVRRPGRDVGMLLDHARPGAWIAVFEVQALGIRTVAQDDGMTAFGDGRKDIRGQPQAGVHAGADVPVDVYAVADLAVAVGHRNGSTQRDARWYTSLESGRESKHNRDTVIPRAGTPCLMSSRKAHGCTTR